MRPPGLPRWAGARHHHRRYRQLALGAAIASAALGGALLVGHSVRRSLELLAVERLGRTEWALHSTVPLPADIGARLAAQTDVANQFDIVTLARRPAAIENPARNTHQRGAQVIVAPPQLLDFFPESRLQLLDYFTKDDQDFAPTAVIGETLARTLAAAVGDQLVVTVASPGEIPSSTLFGHRDRATSKLPVRVIAIAPDRGLFRFGLEFDQATPANVFLFGVSRELRTPNTILVGARSNARQPGSELELLNSRLRQSFTLEDLGLTVEAHPHFVAVGSRRLLLATEFVPILRRAAEATGANVGLVSTWLATAIRHGDREVPYATLTAIDRYLPESDAPLTATNPDLILGLPGANAIVIDQLTAIDLDAAIGDVLDLEFLEVADDDSLTTRRHQLRVSAIAAKRGLLADSSLAPRVAGLTDAADIAAWDPPFPIDLSRVHERHERYWDDFRAAPRGLIALATGLDLWRSRHGAISSLRIELDEAHQDAVLEKLRATVPQLVDAAGLSFRGHRAEAVAAASRSAETGFLFVGFSSFVIAAACLLVVLLFGLAIVDRGREIGLRLALGFPRQRVRWELVVEASGFASLGALAGAPLAVAWAWLLVLGLGGWFRPAIGTGDIALHLALAPIVCGALVATAAAVAAIFYASRTMAKQSPVALLSGAISATPLAPGRKLYAASASLTLIAVAVVTAIMTSSTPSPPLHFVLGAVLLALGVTLTAVVVGPRSPGLGDGSNLRMAITSASRQPARSLTAITLIAATSFVLTMVEMSRRGATVADASASGGHALIATASPALAWPLGDPGSRFEHGFGDDHEKVLSLAHIISLRARPGDDTSCLNLYRPAVPRLVGVPTTLGTMDFRFARTSDGRANGFALLARDRHPALPADVIPVIADSETADWVLKLGIGDDLAITGDRGEPLRLRLVATLSGGLFQSELLMGEPEFLRHFPDRSGFAMFLIRCPPDAEAAITQVLEGRLSALDVTTTSARIDGYQRVANTWISAFASIGGIGLLLGLFGLAVVTARNVHERRAEFAILLAVGYSPARLLRLLILENAVVVGVGLAIGATSAAAALLPLGAPLSLETLGVTLGLALVIGTATGWLAARRALSQPLVPALAAE